MSKIRTTYSQLIYYIVTFFIFSFLPFSSISDFTLVNIFIFFCYLVFISSWNLLAGYAGMISLGQQAFIGIAGYVLGLFSLIGMNTLAGLVVGGVVAAVFALLISIPLFKMRGAYFAIGTAVVAELLRLFFTSFRPSEAEAATWGGAGIPIRAAANYTVVELYYMAVFVGIVSLIACSLLLDSKIGLALVAIKDNDRAAASCGVDVFRCKLYVFVLTAFFTGVGGAVFYLFQGHIEPRSAFGVGWTVLIVSSAIIGGVGRFWGPIVGALVGVILQQTLARYIGLNLLIQGALLICIIMIMPRGVVGTVGDKIAAIIKNKNRSVGTMEMHEATSQDLNK